MNCIYPAGMRVKVQPRRAVLEGIPPEQRYTILVTFHHCPQDYVVVFFAPSGKQHSLLCFHEELIPAEPLWWAQLRRKWWAKESRRRSRRLAE